MATTKILSFFIIFICLANTIISSDFQIPLERNKYTALTTYQEMITFLRALDKSSDNVKIEVIGQSVEGRDLVALFFSVEKQFAKKREEKPVILLFCQQHGDEPSSKEAAMFLSRELINDKIYLLKNLDLILVPQIDPDGSERRQRENNNDMDLNRNHAVLSEPETQALHDLFRNCIPEVTLDVHEYDAITEEWVEKGLIKAAQEHLAILFRCCWNLSRDSAYVLKAVDRNINLIIIWRKGMSIQWPG